MKKKEINSLKDHYKELKRHVHLQKKAIKKTGYLLIIRRLTAKILWSSFWLLVLNEFIRNPIILGLTGILLTANIFNNLLTNLISGKVSDLIFGKFFDNFGIKYLNEWIFMLFILDIGLLYKYYFLRLMNNNEK